MKAQLTNQHVHQERGAFTSLLEEAHGFVKAQLCRAAWELAEPWHKEKANAIPGSSGEGALGTALLLLTPVGLTAESSRAFGSSSPQSVKSLGQAVIMQHSIQLKVCYKCNLTSFSPDEAWQTSRFGLIHSQPSGLISWGYRRFPALLTGSGPQCGRPSHRTAPATSPASWPPSAVSVWMEGCPGMLASQCTAGAERCDSHPGAETKSICNSKGNGAGSRERLKQRALIAHLNLVSVLEFSTLHAWYSREQGVFHILGDNNDLRCYKARQKLDAKDMFYFQ